VAGAGGKGFGGSGKRRAARGSAGGGRWKETARPAALLALVALVGGCASVIPEAMRRGAEHDPDFAAILANPERAVGRRVILGGRIIETRPLPAETEIEVLQYPLTADDAPRDRGASGGRFLVLHPGFLDPAVYAPGRRVTVAGDLAAPRERRLGAQPYRYPALAARHLHLWPLRYLDRPWLGIGVGVGINVGR
jgi:outer membrane lipoprotein